MTVKETRNADLLGRKFNRLTVIEKTQDPKGRKKWKCICECGSEVLQSSTRLLGGLVKSCGCARSDASKKKLLDISGQVFGRLTATSRAPDKCGRVAWFCRCECGKLGSYTQNNLSKGNTTSCGCASVEVRAQNGRKNRSDGSGLGYVFDRYKQSAVKRKLVFDLDREVFIMFTSADCHYCGASPNKVSFSVKAKVPYKWNGIDRKDNTLGYTVDNCLTCYTICNHAKHILSYEDFIGWVLRVIRHLNSQG